MKENIHPVYEETEIKCACGSVINTKSTRKNISVEVCSKCHPFYIGKQRGIRGGGRVDKFQKRLEAANVVG